MDGEWPEGCRYKEREVGFWNAKAADHVTVEDEPAGDGERSAALDGWVTAFDRELEHRGDFAASVAAIQAHGCFDVREAVERWVFANPTCSASDTRLEAARPDSVGMEAAVEGAPVPEVPDEPASDAEQTSPRPEVAPSADVAYFHSLLHGGIERAQLDDAFPRLRLVIDEAVGQYQAAAPILSDVPAAPSGWS